jgi:hypothetical protein
LNILFTFVAKQATLMRRSTVLSLSLQLAFPGAVVDAIKCFMRAAQNKLECFSSPNLTFVVNAAAYPSGAAYSAYTVARQKTFQDQTL